MVVVDDGSQPPASSALDDPGAAEALPSSMIRHELPRGQAAGRNSGWARARAPLIAFTDDDCLPAPSWLSELLDVAGAHPGTIVQGRTEPDPEELARRSLLSRTQRITALGPQYQTCNILYPRAVLEALGGFDEQFGPDTAGEDTDLAWRALEHGFRAVFAPAALVHHAVEEVGALAAVRGTMRWSSAVRVIAEHPPTRAMLTQRIFWNVWHYMLWRSVLALLGPRSVRRFLITKHLLALRDRARTDGAGEWSVPLLLLHDIVESCAMVRGALRYRTLVL